MPINTNKQTGWPVNKQHEIK